MMYKGLLAGYTYDESLTQSLVIPGMEAPPPIPPKKRRSVCLTIIQLSYTSNACKIVYISVEMGIS
jgi:hypothetical protein